MTVQRVPLRLLSSLAALALVLALLPGSISSQAAAAAPACIDLNTASVEELTEIVHVGQSTAEVIVGMRPFPSVDGLTAISGIGASRLAAIKEQGLACVGAAAPPPEEPPVEPEPIPSDPPEGGSPDVQDPPDDDPADEAAPDEGDADADNEGDAETDGDAEADGDTGPCVDLNTASAEDLQRIIHIGEVRAQAIIDARPWASLDDLVEVSGVSDARVADIRAQGRVCPADAEQPEGDEDDGSDEGPQHESVAPLSIEVVDCAAPDLLTVVVTNPNAQPVLFTVRVDDTLVAPEQDAAHGSTTVPIDGWSGAGKVSLVWTGDLRNYGASTDVECEPALDPEPDLEPRPEPEPTVPPQPGPAPAPGPEPTPGPDIGASPEDPEDETAVADEVVEAPANPERDSGAEDAVDDGAGVEDIDEDTAVADEVVEAPEAGRDGEAGGGTEGAWDHREGADGDGAPSPAEPAADTTQVASVETSGSDGIVTPTRVDAGGGGLATSGAAAAPLWLLAALAALALTGLGAELQAARGRRRQTVGREA